MLGCGCEKMEAGCSCGGSAGCELKEAGCSDMRGAIGSGIDDHELKEAGCLDTGCELKEAGMRGALGCGCSPDHELKEAGCGDMRGTLGSGIGILHLSYMLFHFS